MSKTAYFQRIFFLFILISCTQACGSIRQIVPSQNQQSGLSLLLLQSSDFNLQIEWNTDWTSPEYKISEGSNSFERVIRSFDGQMDNHSSVSFTHDLLCFKEPYSLESPSQSNIPEIKLHVLEFGDKSESFCKQWPDTQDISCSTETHYSNLVSRITVWVDQDLSNITLLEELINTALTVTNDRVVDHPVCE